jgi:hypothetical protein
MVKHAFGVIVAMVVLTTPAIAWAQEMSGGFRAGVNLSDVSFSTAPSFESKNLTGFVAGAFLTVPAHGVVAFQPEVLFSRQGTKLVEGGETATFKIDYVQVPLLARFLVSRGAPVGILVGPSLGFKTHATVDAPGSTADFSNAFEESIERFDVGLMTGVSVDVARLVLDGRYTWGLKNIAKESGSESAKNRVFSFTAGVGF